MRYLTFLGGCLGLALTGWLLYRFGLKEIAYLILGVGWGIVPIILFHAVQLFATAFAWKSCIGFLPHIPSLRRFFLMRCVREGVNDLLPVAQLGGDIIGARLLSGYSVLPRYATASVVCDLTMEIITQVIFIAMGVVLFILVAKDTSHLSQVMTGSGMLLVGACLFGGLQYWGGISFLEKLVMRIASHLGWKNVEHLRGLNEAIKDIYTHTLSVLGSGVGQLGGWILGAGEVYTILYFMGYPQTLIVCFIIESIGQIVKSAGFVIPASLGVTEWGYVVVGGALGVPPQIAITLALLKRIREIAWGIPALGMWQWLEGKRKKIQ